MNDPWRPHPSSRPPDTNPPDLSDPDEEEPRAALMRAARAGEPGAAEALERRYRVRLLGVVAWADDRVEPRPKAAAQARREALQAAVRVCPGCGESVTGWWQRVYCSPECRRRHHTLLRRPKRVE